MRPLPEALDGVPWLLVAALLAAAAAWSFVDGRVAGGIGGTLLACLAVFNGWRSNRK